MDHLKPIPSGHVTFTFRKDGKIIDVIEADNVACKFAVINDSVKENAQYTGFNPQMKFIKAPIAAGNNAIEQIDTSLCVSRSSDLAATMSTRPQHPNDDITLSITQRFNSITTSRVIHGLMLTNETYANNQAIVYAYVALPTPFTQAAGVVIDVKYDIVWRLDHLPLNKAQKDSTRILDLFTPVTTSDKYVIGQDYHGLSLWGYTPERLAENYLTPMYGWNQTGLTRNVVNFTVAKSSLIGEIVRSVIDTKYLSSSPTSTSGGHVVTSISPVVKPGTTPYPGYPMSALISHNKTCQVWTEDVGALAAGLGYPVVSSPAPTYKCLGSHPADLHVFRITKSGHVGTSRYDLKVIDVDRGIRSTKTCLEPNGFDKHSSGQARHSNRFLTNSSTVQQDNTWDDQNNWYSFMYNSAYLITLRDNDDGDRVLAITSHLDHGYVKILDKGTTPAIPNTGYTGEGRKTMTRDIAGNLYIAHATGVLKIGTPTTTPTLSTITSATIGVTDTIKTLGYNNARDRLYAFTDTKVAYSDAGGAWVLIDHDSTGIDHIRPSRIHDTFLTLKNGQIGYFALDNAAGTIINVKSLYTAFEYDGNIMESKDGKWTVDFYHSSLARSVVINAEDGDFRYLGYRYGTSMTCTSHTSTSSAGITPLFTQAYNQRAIEINGNIATLPTAGNGITNYRRPVNLGDGPIWWDEVDYGKERADNTLWARNIRNGHTSIYPFPVETDFMDIAGERGNLMHDLGGYGAVYRWDTDTSTWRHRWNKDVSPGLGGASGVFGKRLGFDTDSNLFNGRSLLDITGAVDGVTFANGITFIVKLNRDGDLPLGITGTSTSNGIFMLRDEITKHYIGVYTSAANELRIVTFDGVTEIYSVLATGIPGIGTPYRLAITLSADGTTVTPFIDGVKGTPFTLPAAFALSATMSLTIGGWRYSKLSKGTKLTFKGEISNIQIFDTVVSDAILLTDATSTNLLSSITNLLVMYPMTEDYQEGKPTHLASEVTPFGVNIAFQEGDLSADSYVEGDWYNTVKTETGLFSDNVTSFDIQSQQYQDTVPVAVATSPISGTSVLSGTSVQVNEPTTWNNRPYMVKAYYWYTQGVRTIGNKAALYNGGYYAVQTSQAALATEDLSFEWTHTYGGMYKILLGPPELSHNNLPSLNTGAFAFTTIPGYTGIVPATDLRFGLHTAEQTIAHDPIPGTVFKMVYDSATNTVALYYKDAADVFQQLGTSVAYTLPAGSTTMVFSYYSYTQTPGSTVPDENPGSAISDCMTTYTCKGNWLRLGDRTTKTGSYHTHFLGSREWIYAETRYMNTDMKVLLDGVVQTVDHVPLNNVTVLRDTGCIGTQSEPPIGTVRFYPNSGYLEFNSAATGTVAVSDARVMIAAQSTA